MYNIFCKKPVFYWLFLYTVFLSGCNIESQPIPNSTNKVRLITLAPHLAELVYSAGAEDSLIGVVAYSDFPEIVKSIDLVGDAFKLDYEKIITLQPDYILTWKGGTPIAVIEKLKSLKLNVIETEITRLIDIPKTIEQIAELTQTRLQASKSISTFNQALNEIKQLPHQDKSVFIETYHSPLYTVSGEHWMSQAALLCGYNNIFNDLSSISAPVTLEAVITKNPQAILNIAPQKDKQWQSWKELEAVKTQQVITIHPDYFSRPSMRILEGIKQLCEFN